ncbi:MAG: signal protein, partial [Acidobacteria bacterium]|nr:signal protein [Acidobacteriota bacterium]
MIVAALLLAVAVAQGNPAVHVVRIGADGSVAPLKQQSELREGESAWIWSASAAPARLLGPSGQPAILPVRTVQVKVIGPAHKPEPNASVRWGSEAMLREVPDALLPEAVTDAGGIVTIVASAKEPLFARVAGPATGSGWKALPVTMKILSIHALPAASLRTRVVDRQGRGATNARVEIRDAASARPGAMPMWCFAPDGRTSVPGLPAGGTVELLAWSDELAPSVTITHVATAPPTIALEPGVFFGAALSDEAKQPLGEVEARVAFLLPRSGRVMTRLARSDRGGRLHLGGLPEGEAHWVFSRQGFAGLLGAGTLPPPGRDLGAVLMRRGRELAIKVVDEDGKPVAGAMVRMLDGSGQALSGANGVTTLQHVAAGASEASVSAKGFRAGQFDIPDPIRKPLQVTLVRGAAVRARIATADGLPLTLGGKVMMEIDGSRSSMEFDGDTFELDGLPAGKLRLEIRPAGLAPFRMPVRKLALGERVDLGTLRLDAGLTLRGTVVDDATGVPVPGASLRVLRPNTFSTTVSMVMGDTVEAESGEAGEFRLAGLSPGVYVLSAEAPGFGRTVRADLHLREDPETDIGTVRMPAARTLAIHCLPVEKCGTEVRVLLAGAQNDWAAVDAPLVEGRAVLLPVASGAATLRLIDGREIVAEKEIAIAADRERTELEIDLGSTKVSGVVTRGGAAVAGGSLTFLSGAQTPRRIVQVSQSGESGAFAPRIVGDLPRQVAVSVDAQGRFLTGELGAGDYNVTYVDQRGQSAPRTVSIADVAESNLQLDWPAGQIRGYVQMRDGIPAGGATVSIRDADGQTPRTMTSADGTFTISGLAAGAAEISASKGKNRAQQTSSVGDPARD